MTARPNKFEHFADVLHAIDVNYFLKKNSFFYVVLLFKLSKKAIHGISHLIWCSKFKSTGRFRHIFCDLLRKNNLYYAIYSTSIQIGMTHINKKKNATLDRISTHLSKESVSFIDEESIFSRHFYILFTCKIKNLKASVELLICLLTFS